VNALRLQFGSAADVIVVVGVAAIDDHIVLFEERYECLQRLIDHGGRHHHPDGARRFSASSGEVFNRRCADRTVFDERLRGFRMNVVNNALVTGP
jgi:hypothetical protein